MSRRSSASRASIASTSWVRCGHTPSSSIDLHFDFVYQISPFFPLLVLNFLLRLPWPFCCGLCRSLGSSWSLVALWLLVPSPHCHSALPLASLPFPARNPWPFVDFHNVTFFSFFSWFRCGLVVSMVNDVLLTPFGTLQLWPSEPTNATTTPSVPRRSVCPHLPPSFVLSFFFRLVEYVANDDDESNAIIATQLGEFGPVRSSALFLFVFVVSHPIVLSWSAAEIHLAIRPHTRGTWLAWKKRWFEKRVETSPLRSFPSLSFPIPLGLIALLQPQAVESW